MIYSCIDIGQKKIAVAPKSGYVTMSLFLTVIFVSAMAPVVVFAQERKEAAIAVLLWRGQTEAERAFINTLEGSEKWAFTFDQFDAGQDFRLLEEMVNRLDPTKYRLIYTFGTFATRLAKERIKGVPLVYIAVPHPVKRNIVKSWTHSGNALSGVSSSVPISAIFETITKMRLATSLVDLKIGFVYSPLDENSLIQKEKIEEAAIIFGYKPLFVEITAERDIGEMATRIENRGVDIVVLADDSTVGRLAPAITKSLTAKQIPTLALMPDLARGSGAMIGLGPDYSHLGQVAAGIALEFLDGARATDVESQRPKLFKKVVNLSVAKAIGVTFSEEALKDVETVR